jgi:hypothetical protein
VAHDIAEVTYGAHANSIIKFLGRLQPPFKKCPDNLILSPGKKRFKTRNKIKNSAGSIGSDLASLIIKAGAALHAECQRTYIHLFQIMIFCPVHGSWLSIHKTNPPFLILEFKVRV